MCYSGDVVSKDVLKSFHNLLQGTSAKKLDEDLDILWASKGGNVDLSKWSKDDFSTGLIPDYIDCKYFAAKHFQPHLCGEKWGRGEPRSQVLSSSRPLE